MSKGLLVLEATIEGKPEPQGSATAFVIWKDRPGKNKWEWVPARRRDGSIIVNVTSDNPKLKAWRELVAGLVREALAGKGVRLDPAEDPRPFPLEGVGFTAELVSYLKRREADWGTGRNAHLLKDAAVAMPLGVPDVDKLLRGALDALTGVVWADDSQVTDGATRKRFAVPYAGGDGIRAEVRVWLNVEQRAADLPLEERVRHVPGRAGDEDETAQETLTL